MIQRIQSLWFLLAGVIMGLMIFMPWAAVNNGENIMLFSFRGFASEGTWCWMPVYWIAPVIAAIVGLLSLGNIFLFNNRTLQVRVCLFNIILSVLWYAVMAGVVFFAFKKGNMEFGANMFNVLIATAFPLVAIILTWLGMRGVLKDDALVKSLNRLR